MKSAGEVNLRAPVLMQVVGLPLLGIFDVGLIWGVVDAVRTGDPDYPFRSSGIHGAGVVIGWIIAGAILVPSLFATVALRMLRVQFAHGRIRMRKFLRYRTIELTDLTSVIVTDPAAWRVNGFRSSVAPCLELRGRTPEGRRAYIGFNAKFLDYTAALRWLGPWLREHPDRSDNRTLALLDHLGDPDDPGDPDDSDPRAMSADRPIDAMDLVHQLRNEQTERTRDLS